MRSVLMISRLCAVLWLQCLRAADSLDTWTLRSSPLPSTNWLYSIAYGSDQFVAVGGSPEQIYPGLGVIVTSSDGTDWTQRPVFSGRILDVTHGGGLFVAVGVNRLLVSPDGTTWTSPLFGGGRHSAVAYGRNMFVAALGENAYTSANASNWTARPLPFETSFKSLIFGYDEFVAVGGHAGTGGIWTSTNGTAWTMRSSDDLADVSFSGSMFVAAGGKGTVTTSFNSTTWLPRNSETTNLLLGVGYGGGTFVVVGSHGTILTSTDAAKWTARSSGVTNDLTAVAYGNGHFVAVGANGTILESGPIIRFEQFRTLLNDAVQFTLEGPAGQNCQIQTSTDLTNWIGLTDVGLAKEGVIFVILPSSNSSGRFFRAIGQ